ncbi:hypothetical protein DDB_G0290627 [Dictyostelium discoideum AX4]|uniref:EGF-like domain-containing protein n=1 Tax=Dictyostelium discoideum TaxID=44689 RepID=Q54FR6_DICDI|nr:hypothetical protein DDB_G0290627 [Dictyostelium discoideum AX4]EAL62174.1 hypothetical protein DDB_G0290627 [Dictyostelium discoideum AX4]|eukprot:XP_635701.1 hypothetical protein DDB_G0290627 [Dictyostelium discoideum AX4]
MYIIKLYFLILLINNYYNIILTQGSWSIDTNVISDLKSSELNNLRACAQEGRYGSNCEKTKPEVFQLVPANLEGGEVSLVGYFYDKNEYKITIDNIPCNITSYDNYSIKCNIGELKDYEPVDFKIYQNGIIWTYPEYTPFPECENGYITSGFIKCVCDFGYVGTNCDKDRPISIDQILTQPEEKGGFFRAIGFFGKYPNPMNFIVGDNNNNRANISFIDSREIFGFVKGDIGCKKISIYDSITNELLFSGNDLLCFDANRCNNMYYNQSKDFYCLCEPTLKGFPRCSDYFQKSDIVNPIVKILDDYNFKDPYNLKDIIIFEDTRVNYSIEYKNGGSGSGSGGSETTLSELTGRRICWEAGYFGKNCEKFKPEVFQLKPAKVDGGEVRLIGYFYKNQIYRITIDNKPCNITSRNNYTIRCNIGKLLNYNNEPLQFKIIQNEIIWNFSEYKPLSNCKFGYISGGFYECHCKYGYIGPNCDQKKQITIDSIKTQPDSNGGFFRAVGYFGNDPNSLKFLIGRNNLINVTYIDHFNLVGFVNRNSGCKNITIFNENSNIKIFEGGNVCFIKDPCIYIYHDLDYYCLCEPAPKNDPKCSEYNPNNKIYRKNFKKLK